MSQPLHSEHEAHILAIQLITAFKRDPDTLSPNEQALVMAILMLERASNEVVARLQEMYSVEPEQD
jgi:hypothetical protein